MCSLKHVQDTKATSEAFRSLGPHIIIIIVIKFLMHRNVHSRHENVSYMGM